MRNIYWKIYLYRKLNFNINRLWVINYFHNIYSSISYASLNDRSVSIKTVCQPDFDLIVSVVLFFYVPRTFKVFLLFVWFLCQSMLFFFLFARKYHSLKTFHPSHSFSPTSRIFSPRSHRRTAFPPVFSISILSCCA